MLVYLYGVGSFGVVAMFIDSSVGLLCLQFPDIMFSVITAITPCQVDGVFRPASGFLAYLESFAAGPIGEYTRVHDVSATSGICPSTAWGASAGLFRDGPNDLSSSELCLSKDITQILVPPEANAGLLRKFPALGLVNLQYTPAVVYDLSDIR